MKRTALALVLLVATGCSTAGPQHPPAPVSGASQTTPAPASGPVRLSSIRMVSEAAGWATGLSGVFRTSDGGQSWKAVTPSGITPMEHMPSFFLDADRGWVAMGKTIYRTDDGGATWRSVPHPADETKVLAFADPQNGWLMTHDGAATGGTELVTIYRSTDGGTNWAKVAQAGPPGAALSNFPMSGVKRALTFTDGLTGWATVRYTNVNALGLYRTTDGGGTWERQSVTPVDVLKQDDAGTWTTGAPMLFSGGRLVLPVFSGRCDDEKPCAVVYGSSDGGKTWNPTATLRMEQRHPLVYDFADPEHGWVVDGSVLHTTRDGGKTWTTLTPSGAWQPLRQVDFVSPEVGWALEETGLELWKTVDGGATWTKAGPGSR